MEPKQKTIFDTFNFRTFIFSSFYSILFTFFLLLGDNLNTHLTIWAKFNVFHYAAIFCILNLLCYLFLDNIDTIINKVESIKIFPKLENIFFKDSKKCFWNCFLFITICHLPIFLAYFPGIFTYDTYYQLNVFTLNNRIEIHPIMHTLMIYAVWLFEKTFHTTWVGVFIYTAIQSLITIGIYSYCIKLLSKFNTAYYIKFLSLLFFAFYPTNQIFHLIATKDAYFCIFVLLFVLLLTELTLDKESFLSKKSKKIFLFSSILLMLLFRHNGFHAYLMCLPFFIFYFRKDIKKVLPIFLTPVLFILVFSIIKVHVGLEPPSSASALAVPLQQMARVRQNQAQFLSEEEKEQYVSIVSKEKEEVYDFWSVDAIKLDDYEIQRSDYIEKALKTNLIGIIKLYAKWGIRYPIDYIDAFLLNTYKYWYVEASWKATGYPHSYLATHQWYTDYYGVELEEYSLLPKLQYWYDMLLARNSFYLLPVANAMFAIAYNTWFIILGFVLLFYRKKYNYIVVLSIIPALFITALLGPTVVIRYVWQNFQILPLLLAFCFSNLNITVEKN